MLSRQPEHNAYLLAQVARGSLGASDVAGVMLGFRRDGRLEGICALGANLVVSVPSSDGAIEAFALSARREGANVRVVVGHDGCVDRLMQAYGRSTRPIRLERANQVLYRVDRDTLVGEAGSTRLRQADVAETGALVDMDRAMVSEELGFDPFADHLDSYRYGWLRRIREGRAWVIGGPQRGGLVFKIDQSAVSDAIVQISGVYTRPDHRRQGLAREGTAELCRRLLVEAGAVTLYVHAENTSALALYESLGFQGVGRVRSVWFA